MSRLLVRSSGLADDEEDDESLRQALGVKQTWTGAYERTWEQTVSHGLSHYEHQETLKLLNRRAQRQTALYSLDSMPADSTQNIQRGLNRHVVLVLDLGRSGEQTDYLPTRAKAMVQEVQSFVEAYFDQNPISQLALIATFRGVAKKLTELSGNTSRQLEALSTAMRHSGGDPSLENSLRMALSSLYLVPRCGTREVIIAYASLVSCDPGDINEVLAAVIDQGISVSVLGLGAEMRICKHICEASGGKYYVATDRDHLHELFFKFLPPPVQLASSKLVPALIKMGFPSSTSDQASICSCHRELRLGGFLCPQCLSKYCELPIDCSVCGLSLISSPQLARSFHHLFPIPLFVLHKPASSDEPDSPALCLGCHDTISAKKPSFHCPSCNQRFCFNCDELIHESLHVCPGCEGVRI